MQSQSLRYNIGIKELESQICHFFKRKRLNITKLKAIINTVGILKRVK